MQHRGSCNHTLHPLVCTPHSTSNRKHAQLHDFSIARGWPRKKKVTFQHSEPLATKMKSSGKVEWNTHTCTHMQTHVNAQFYQKVKLSLQWSKWDVTFTFENRALSENNLGKNNHAHFQSNPSPMQCYNFNIKAQPEQLSAPAPFKLPVFHLEKAEKSPVHQRGRQRK